MDKGPCTNASIIRRFHCSDIAKMIFGLWPREPDPLLAVLTGQSTMASADKTVKRGHLSCLALKEGTNLALLSIIERWAYRICMGAL